jgi:hypothetical protein
MSRADPDSGEALAEARAAVQEFAFGASAQFAVNLDVTAKYRQAIVFRWHSDYLAASIL